jgi:hypothetical protein
MKQKTYVAEVLCVAVLMSVLNACSSPKIVESPVQNLPKQTSNINISEEKVRSFLNLWEQSQDSKNFSTYENCYSVEFTGIKRVGNKTIKYNFADWIKDRRTMMQNADNLNIKIENLKITFDGDTAIAQFTQHYRSRQYADVGTKTLNIKLETNNLKITFEELGFSTVVHD